MDKNDLEKMLGELLDLHIKPSGEDAVLTLGDAIRDVGRSVYEGLTSTNVSDSNLEAANIVDTTQRIAQGLQAVAKAVDGLADAVRSHGES